MQKRTVRSRPVCNLPLSCVFIAALAFTGCEEKVPSSEHARILLMTRPELIDRSNIEEFSIHFDNADPLAQPVTVVDGSKLHVSGTLKPKDGVLNQREYLSLQIGRRPIVDGRADWTIDESQESVERLIKFEWMVGTKENIDTTVPVATDPGEYELRFYAVRDNGMGEWDYRPEIYLLGEGRMTVLPQEKLSATGESTPPKK